MPYFGLGTPHSKLPCFCASASIAFRSVLDFGVQMSFHLCIWHVLYKKSHQTVIADHSHMLFWTGCLYGIIVRAALAPLARMMRKTLMRAQWMSFHE